MRDAKSIILVVVIVLLIGAAGYLTYMISNGQDPLVLLNSQAANNEDATNPDLLANAGNQNNDPIPDENSPTPTKGFKSTSPTATPSGGPNITMTTKPTQMPTITSLPETGGSASPSPTPMETLPVAGVSDFLSPVMLSGGILILFALFL